MGEYFVRIDGATELRRKVLESSKASINVLRGYQALVQTRGEKKTMINALRRELKELTMLVNRLEEMLPSLSKSEVEELNRRNDLPKLETGKKSRMKPKKRRRSPRKTSERAVYVGHPGTVHTRKPAPMPAPKAPPEPMPAPKKEETLHDKLSSIEEKLRKL